jgi:hypothetical protein
MMDPKQVDSLKYFGPHMAAHDGKMVEFVKETVADAVQDPDDKADLDKIVVALAAEAQLPIHREADARDAALIEEGREAMTDSAYECTDCHNYRDKKASLGGANRGPDLTGYGSREWTIQAIRNIEHPAFYPGDRNDRMPLYGEQKILDDRQIGMIADWLRNDPGGASAAESVAAPAAAPAATSPDENEEEPVKPAPATSPATVPAAAPTTPTAQTKPAETKPAETKPVETKMAEPPMAETPKPDAPKPDAPAPGAPAPEAPAPGAPGPGGPKPEAPGPPGRKSLESEFEDPAAP